MVGRTDAEPRRLTLTVVEEVDCPLFRAGDRMVLELPSVDVEASDAVCARTLAALLGGGHGCRSGDTDYGEELWCPRAQDPVHFRVEPEARPVPSPEDAEATSDLENVAARLAGVPVFRGLPTPFLVGLAAQMTTRRYPNGALVVERGQSGTHFFVIDDGHAEVLGHGGGMIEAVVRTFGPQECFGEMSLLTGAPTSATVRARGPLVVLALDVDAFDQLLVDQPFMAARFARLVAARLLATNFLLAREGNQAFRGKLSVMGVATVLQVLAESRRTNRLRFRSPSGEDAAVVFREGSLVDAVCGELRGPSAVFAMLRWTDGDFWLDPEPPLDVGQPTEDLGLMGLLLEGMRRIDEGLQP